MPRNDRHAMIADSNFAESRARRLAEIRRQVEEGTYETPEKLEAAVEAMLSRLDKQGDPPPAPKPR